MENSKLSQTPIEIGDNGDEEHHGHAGNDEEAGDDPFVGSFLEETRAHKESDDEKVFDYESEDLHTPIGSDAENDVCRTGFDDLSEGAECGEVKLEIGMKFDTLDQFKRTLKDWTVAHGRELQWLKNDKLRSRGKTISHQLTPLSLCLQRQNLVVATVAYSLPFRCRQKRISQFLALFTLSEDLSIFLLRFAIAVTACLPPLHCCQKPVLQRLTLLSLGQ
ncbi:hypothetical protein S83_035132 [Arachis hypogaea]